MINPAVNKNVITKQLTIDANAGAAVANKFEELP